MSTYMSVLYWTQDLSNSKAASVRAEREGLYYYVYLRSIYFDGDVDFANDYRLMGNHFRFPKHRKTRKFINKFFMGSGVFWLPGIVVADFVLL